MQVRSSEVINNVNIMQRGSTTRRINKRGGSSSRENSRTDKNRQSYIVHLTNQSKLTNVLLILNTITWREVREVT